MRNLIRTAMNRADDLVVEMEYRDAKGERTTRVVSPIRFLGKNRFLGLCLCRCEPRQFHFVRCSNLALQNAHDYLMPVPMMPCPPEPVAAVEGAVEPSATATALTR